MHRRHLLAAAAAATGLAGCIGNGDGTTGPGGNGTTNGMNDGDPAPTIESQSVETTGTDCASGDVESASVDRADGTVTVTGSLETPNPCHEATLDSVDVEDERLHVVVAATSTSDMCQQCIGEVGYESTIEVANAAALSGVTVDHVDGGSFGTDWSDEER